MLRDRITAGLADARWSETLPLNPGMTSVALLCVLGIV